VLSLISLLKLPKLVIIAYNCYKCCILCLAKLKLTRFLSAIVFHSYYVQLPDGRRLLVEYYVDASGYHPTVTFEGEAQYPSGGNRGYGQSGQGSSQGSPSQLYGAPSK